MGVCKERREGCLKRWREMGGGVGKSEFEFKRV
jgi:hypothetical protein